MDWVIYILDCIVDFLEEFFNIYKSASGKAGNKVLVYSFIYFGISVFCSLLGKFTFVDVKSAILATVILFILNIHSNVKKKQITKFIKVIGGNEDGEFNDFGR